MWAARPRWPGGRGWAVELPRARRQPIAGAHPPPPSPFHSIYIRLAHTPESIWQILRAKLPGSVWKPARIDHRIGRPGAQNTQPMGGFVVGGAITRLLAGLMGVQFVMWLVACTPPTIINATSFRISYCVSVFVPSFRIMSIVFIPNGGANLLALLPRVEILPAHLSRLHHNGWWWTGTAWHQALGPRFGRALTARVGCITTPGCISRYP